MPRAARTRLPRIPDSPGPFDGRVLEPGEDVVAVGGTLEPGLVWHAYRHGVFPWYEAGGPVVWWCPDPRAAIPLARLHVPRRLERTLAGGRWSLTRDRAFPAVVSACARERAEGTWIHPEVEACYLALFARGQARSFEVWHADRLVGGLFGLPLGRVFCAESMFHRERDASKAALACAARALAEEGVELLEVQFLTAHLAQFGAVELPRAEYLRYLRA